MGFRFFDKNENDDQSFERIFDEAERLEAQLDRYDPELHGSPEPAVYTRINRDRDSITDEEWDSIIRQQRHALIEHMWRQRWVTTTTISQDENGFTLRTELNLLL